MNILIAWPYGMYRDSFMRAARKVSPSGWIKNLADILAYVTFQSPVYVAILLVVGADWHQIMAAVSSNIVVSMLMGAVYGYFLDYCRRLFSQPLPAGKSLTLLFATGIASRVFNWLRQINHSNNVQAQHAN